MATELDARILELVDKAGKFEPKPYYEPAGDSVIFYARNVASHEHWVNDLVTLFLSNDDKSLVGCEIKSVKLMLSTARKLGFTIQDCRLKLSILLLYALGPLSEPDVVALIDRHHSRFVECGQIEVMLPDELCTV